MNNSDFYAKIIEDYEEQNVDITPEHFFFTVGFRSMLYDLKNYHPEKKKCLTKLIEGRKSKKENLITVSDILKGLDETLSCFDTLQLDLYVAEEFKKETGLEPLLINQDIFFDSQLSNTLLSVYPLAYKDLLIEKVNSILEDSDNLFYSEEDFEE